MRTRVRRGNFRAGEGLKAPWHYNARDRFANKTLPSRVITIRHRLRQPSRSYIVGASISSDALKGNCG